MEEYELIERLKLEDIEIEEETDPAIKTAMNILVTTYGLIFEDDPEAKCKVGDVFADLVRWVSGWEKGVVKNYRFYCGDYMVQLSYDPITGCEVSLYRKVGEE